MTLSRNKAKPGECALSCWEAPSAAAGLQALTAGLCFSASCSTAGRDPGQAGPAVGRGESQDGRFWSSETNPHGVGLVCSPLGFSSIEAGKAVMLDSPCS